MSKYPALNSYLENLSNLKGKAKIDYLCSYIESLAEKQMNAQIDYFLDHKMVFSELKTKVKIFHHNLISQDEIKDIKVGLINMKYEIWHKIDIDEEHITFTLET